VSDPSRAWLEWHREHEEALAALQVAQHAYHRTVAQGAFAGAADGPSIAENAEMQQGSLEVLEAARVRLDEIRARKPEA
jgi:fructoselysine-6-P-deglycase FrlB-like protein